MNSRVGDPSCTALVSTQQGHMAQAGNNSVGVVYKKEERKKKKDRCRGWGILVLGLSLIVFSLLVFMLDPAEQAVIFIRRFGPGTFMFKHWLRPPMKMNLNFYVFNYTNSEAFMRGEEALRIEEIGPYSIEEIPMLENVTFNDNNTLTYIPKRIIRDDPGASVGDPLEDMIVVPNFIFLGLASYLADSSFFTNTAFNVFAQMVKSEPFLTMSVDSFLRGHDEPLLSYASKVMPTALPARLSFVDTIVHDGRNIVTINLNDRRVKKEDGSIQEPFSVDQYNGSPGMEFRGYVREDNSTHKICNTFKGVTSEGGLVPRELTEDLRINFYRKAFCRTIPFVVDRPGVTSKGAPAFWLKFKEDSFHNSNPENSCYCLEEPCLPDGITDMSPCLYGMPWAMSFPHFLYGDPSLVEPWNATFNPNFKEHGTYALMDKAFGAVMHARMRVQLNLVMGHTKYNALAQPFNGMVLPAMWTEYQFNDMPDHEHNLIYICVVVLPYINYAVIVVLAVAGFALLLRAFFRSSNAQSIYRKLTITPVLSSRRRSEVPEQHRLEAYGLD